MTRTPEHAKMDAEQESSCSTLPTDIPTQHDHSNFEDIRTLNERQTVHDSRPRSLNDLRNRSISGVLSII